MLHVDEQEVVVAGLGHLGHLDGMTQPDQETESDLAPFQLVESMISGQRHGHPPPFLPSPCPRAAESAVLVRAEMAGAGSGEYRAAARGRRESGRSVPGNRRRPRLPAL